jgi:hypothetical protein
VQGLFGDAVDDVEFWELAEAALATAGFGPRGLWTA